MHPDDAADAAGLIASARERLPDPPPEAETQAEAEAEPGPEPQAASYKPPAFAEDVHVQRGEPAAALREELHRWAQEDREPKRRDLWGELAGDADKPDDEGPPADVTPLYPPQPD